MADKVYIATLTQTGTNAPSATELTNTLGNLVWTRGGAGSYVGTLANAFTPLASSSISIPVMTNIITAVIADVHTCAIAASGDGVLTAREVRLLVSTHYCSMIDLEDRIGRTNLAELTNDTANATIGSPSVIETILTDVDAAIDAKCGNTYTVPFTTVPDIILDIATELACYKAMQRKPTNVGVSKDWQTIYTDAMQTLEDIAAMKVLLPATATVASPQSAIETLETYKLVDFNDEDNGMYNF